MKITIFQSDKGDCLLITGADGHTILVDGGMRSSYTAHVAPTLNRAHRNGRKLDLVYVSHIDQDHISGILQMVDDTIEWRVYEHHQRNGERGRKPPTMPRPPEIGEIWHNAFHEQLGENSGDIADMLAASATVLFGAEDEKGRGLAEHYDDLATSTAEAIQLSRRVGPEQLGIPLNASFDGRLMYVPEDTGPIALGTMALYVIGPFEEDLLNLRKEWNEWLRNNRKRLKDIARRSQRDAERLAANEIDPVLAPKVLQASELMQALEEDIAQAMKLGDRREVTTPNLASLMLYVEEGDRTLLLTGDGHCDDILAGLRHYGKLSDEQGLHVDVLKVQHHGSQHNIDENFAKTITADHYIFCGNGAHTNPEIDVVKLIIDSRVGPSAGRSTNPDAGRPFKLWFNSSSQVDGKAANLAHMRKLEKLVEREAQQNKKIRYRFMTDSSVTLKI